MERGEFSPCRTPTGLDFREPFALQLGARMFYNTQDMLWRRKLDAQTDLQQVLELQNRRLMGLQLLDVKKHEHQRSFSSGSPIPSPAPSPTLYSQSLVLPQFYINQEAPQENCSSPMPAISITTTEKQLASTASSAGKESSGTEENSSDKEGPRCEGGDLPESVEHNLPDSPFASPAKASGDNYAFPNAIVEKMVRSHLSLLTIIGFLQPYFLQIKHWSSHPSTAKSPGFRPDIGPLVCMPVLAARLAPSEFSFLCFGKSLSEPPTSTKIDIIFKDHGTYKMYT